MKILFLCADRGIPIRGDKGASVHVRMMVSAFACLGHEPVILCPRAGSPDGPEPAGTLIEIPLPAPPVDRSGDLADLHQFMQYNDILLEAAEKLVREGGFDFIYERYALWSDAGSRLARATGLPLALEVNAPLIEEAARYRRLPDRKLAEQIARAQFQAAALITVVSEPLRRYAVENGANRERVHVLPNGVEAARFHPAVDGAAVRRRFGLQERFVVGFVGRPRPWHDLETLGRAVKKLRREDPRCHLLLVGQMPDRLPAVFSSDELKREVTFAGAVPHDQVPHYIAAMDAAVSPHPPLENFYFSPLKLFEYMACGVPAVAARIGQPAALIRHKVNGMLYRPGSVSDLAGCLRYLARKPARADRIGWEGAVSVLRSRTWEQNAAAVIRWIAADRPRPAAVEAPAGPALPLLDEKLRRPLYAASRPDLVAPVFRRHLPPFGPDGAYWLDRVDRVALLKYKPGRRCVLAYDLAAVHQPTGRPARIPVIGKVFRDNRGEWLHRIHAFLQANGFGANSWDGLSVPESLAAIPELQMQVQARVAGRTLHELAAQTRIAHLMPVAARALAKLHRLTPPADLRWLPSYLLGDELENLGRFRSQLLDTRPADRELVCRLFDQLGQLSEDLASLPEPALVHRDFYYSQLLFQGEKVALIDFDLFSMGDPAIDVANFIAHLHFLGLDLHGDFHTYAGEAADFLSHYVQFRPVDLLFLERMAFYQAATYFRLLNVVASRPGLVHLFYPIASRTTDFLEMA